MSSINASLQPADPGGGTVVAAGTPEGATPGSGRVSGFGDGGACAVVLAALLADNVLLLAIDVLESAVFPYAPTW